MDWGWLKFGLSGRLWRWLFRVRDGFVSPWRRCLFLVALRGGGFVRPNYWFAYVGGIGPLLLALVLCFTG